MYKRQPEVEAEIVIVSLNGSDDIVTFEPATRVTVSEELSATILLPPAAIVLKASEAPPPLAVIVILLFELSVVIDIPEPATKLRACDKLLEVTVSCPETVKLPKANCCEGWSTHEILP